MKPYIIFEEGEYHLYFSILEKQYDIKLTKNDGFYNGVGNYEKIGKMEFLFYEDATLKIIFTYNEEIYEYFFEK
ncbi:unknown [Firmicutes bacterium CAG:449]|nr:unknown [Firmicutes bacterium CAG:449]